MSGKEFSPCIIVEPFEAKNEWNGRLNVSDVEGFVRRKKRDIGKHDEI